MNGNDANYIFEKIMKVCNGNLLINILPAISKAASELCKSSGMNKAQFLELMDVSWESPSDDEVKH